jgi:hypothetical protein
MPRHGEPVQHHVSPHTAFYWLAAGYKENRHLRSHAIKIFMLQGLHLLADSDDSRDAFCESNGLFSEGLRNSDRIFSRPLAWATMASLKEFLLRRTCFCCSRQTKQHGFQFPFA